MRRVVHALRLDVYANRCGTNYGLEPFYLATLVVGAYAEAQCVVHVRLCHVTSRLVYECGTAVIWYL